MHIVLCAEVSAERVIGGAERVLHEQALGLQRLGHQVSILARSPEADPRPLVSLAGCSEYRYTVDRRHEGTFVFSTLRNSARVFRKIAGGRPPDVVIVHQALAGLGPLFLRKQYQARWIYVCHSLAHEEYLTRSDPPETWVGRLRHKLNVHARWRMERFMMRACTQTLVLSDFMRQRVEKVHHLPADRIVQSVGACDPALFCPSVDSRDVKRQLGLESSRLLLFAVRNLVPRMGFENLIEAMSLLGCENDGVLLVIGGEGPLCAKLQSLIEGYGLRDRVRLLGFVPESDLVRYYQAADFVLMPTLQLEGFGLVTVEALACGTPVIATPVGALPEVLSRVDRSLIAAGTDAPSLAHALRRFIRIAREEPGRYDALSRKGRQVVKDLYTWDRHCADLQRVFSQDPFGRMDDSITEGAPRQHAA